MKLTDLQERWLQALESGEYQQTNLRLADAPWVNSPDEDDQPGEPVAFCCMGVGCEILKKAGLIESYDPNQEYPPTEVTERIGWIDTEDGKDCDQKGTTELAELNDTKKLPFVEIAAEVRAHPEKYFVSSGDSQD